MIKREVTYEDYNDPPQTHTETYYFHLTTPDLMEMEFDTAGGMVEHLQNLIKAEDMGALLRFIKQFTLNAVGIKSDDGKGFKKTAAYRESFEASAAYTQLYMDLVSDQNLAAEFIVGVMPKEVQEEAARQGTDVKAKIAAELGIKSDAPIETVAVNETLSETKPTPEELRAQIDGA